jgi:hypothetical protein
MVEQLNVGTGIWNVEWWNDGTMGWWSDGILTYQVSDGQRAVKPVRSYDLIMERGMVASENKTRPNRVMEWWNN